MKRILTAALAIAIALSFWGASCARQPSAKSSANIIKSFFKKYGKKYPDTVFGKSRVKEVEVTGQHEIHKDMVSVEAFLTFQDGTVERVNATLAKSPAFWWRFTSWENATN